MSEVLSVLVVGLVTGSIYSLAGMGLVLTYKTSGVFNFAHGTFAALAAYIMFELWNDVGLPWPVAVVLAILLAGVVGGLLLERLAFALSTATTAARVVATVGLLVALQTAITLRYGFNSIAVRDRFLPDGTTEVLGVFVRTDQFIVVVVALVAAIGLYAFFSRARVGVAMQAVVDDATLLGLQGISPVRIRRLAWVVGSSFAALSGILLAPDAGFVDVNILTLLVVQAFGAAAVGAFNSLPLTYVGGLLVGLLTATAVKLTADTPSLANLPPNVPFLVLFLVLLALPKRRLVERGARVVRRLPPPPTFSTRTLVVAASIGLGVLLLVPELVDVKLVAYIDALAAVILFASLGLLVNTSGQVSLCHMVFLALGASTFGKAMGAGFPWGVSVLLAGLVAVPLGAVVAIPAIRLSGVYLAVATFGFGILVEKTFFGTFLMFGRSQSVATPRPGVLFQSDAAYYYLVLAITIACCTVVLAVRRSRLGRLLRGMADSDTALAAHGTNTNTTRVFVFCISAFLAGIAGAVAAPATGNASAVQFIFFNSVVVIAVLAIAGRMPILSPVIAALLFKVFPQEVPDQALLDYQGVLFGVGAIVAAIGPFRALMAISTRSRRAEGRAERTPARSRRRPPTVEAVPA